jgi:3-hydroxyisobutyrate dehydrogenase-like beta-hydroxyacid dehydrogenase
MASKAVYLSYVTSDRAHAERLRHWLERNEVRVIDAARDLPAGDDRAKGIRACIEGADLVVFMIGEATHQSRLVQDEVTLARELGKAVGFVKIDASVITPPALYAIQAQCFPLSAAGESILAALSGGAPPGEG